MHLKWICLSFYPKFGCFFNAHAHIDRAYTYEDGYLAHVGKTASDLVSLSLAEKQDLVGAIHSGKAYDLDDLRGRMVRVLEESIECGVRRLDSCIDTTNDNVGLSGLEIGLELKETYQQEIDFRVGAYNVFGFKRDSPGRWELFREACSRADFLVGLQERDVNPGHIGEEQHVARLLRLGYELKKPIHFHVDQANVPSERRTEVLLEQMHQVFDVQYEVDDYPEVWAVHAISPSCYSDDRFDRLCDGLVKYGVGVVCCPSAGVSMKQDRRVDAPIHNSLARVWDFVSREIKVVLGSDNISDVFVPSSSPDMMREVLCLTDALRFYDPRILAKLASGKEMDNFDRGTIRRAFG